MVYQPQLKKDKRKGKPALPKGKVVQPPKVDKERLYFQEVDAYELLEESPSPKKSTWTIGNMTQEEPIPAVCSRLEKWLHSRRLNPFCGPSSTLSKILDTPSTCLETIRDIDFSASDLKILERTDQSNSLLHTIKTEEKETSIENGSHLQTNEKTLFAQSGEGCEDVEAGVKKLSLVSTSSSIDDDHINPFSVLLSICGQSAPSVLQDIFYSGSETIVKVGEGTYGEAFKINNYVCKIVPFDGDFRVNGEVQKTKILSTNYWLLCTTEIRGIAGGSASLQNSQSIERKRWRF